MVQEEIMLIYKSRIQKIAEGADITITKEFIEALNYKIGEFVFDSIRKCKLDDKDVVDAEDLGD